MNSQLAYILLCSLLPFTNLTSQNLTNDQLNFLTENVNEISMEGETDSANWEAFAEEVRDKRLVLIGEFNHGSREVFLLKNRIAEQLHQQLNFDVILFESGIGELIEMDKNRKELSPRQMLSGFFLGWRTTEVADLMAFVKAENIGIAGFDVQRTAGTFEPILQEAILAADLDTMRYFDLESRFGQLRRNLPNRRVELEAVLADTRALIADYQTIYSKLLIAKTEEPLSTSMLVARTIRNRIDYLTYMLQFKRDKNWNRRWAARDSLMAENVIWLSENIYPDSKILVVGHNFHIAKYNEKEGVMGAFLKRKFGEDMYSIGVFAGGGTFLDNRGEAETMVEPDPEHLDIKHVISNLNKGAHFMPIPVQAIPGSEWLREPIVVNDTFIDLSNTNTMILSKYFDALLLLDQVSVPVK